MTTQEVDDMTWLDRPCNICGAETLKEGHYAYAIRIGSDGIPTSLLACRSCFPTAPAAIGSVRSRFERETGSCLSCGKDCEKEFCSDCYATMRADKLEPLDPLSPVSLLLDGLRAVKAKVAIAKPPEDTAHETQVMMSSGAASMAYHAKTKARANVLDTHAEKINSFVPTNEMGVVFMFGAIIDRIGWKMAYMDGRYPDAVAVNPNGQRVKIEFEFHASSFVAHGHDPEFCDLVVCWENDRQLAVQVLELAPYYNIESGKWDFSNLA